MKLLPHWHCRNRAIMWWVGEKKIITDKRQLITSLEKSITFFKGNRTKILPPLWNLCGASHLNIWAMAILPSNKRLTESESLVCKYNLMQFYWKGNTLRVDNTQRAKALIARSSFAKATKKLFCWVNGAACIEYTVFSRHTRMQNAP